MGSVVVGAGGDEVAAAARSYWSVARRRGCQAVRLCALLWERPCDWVTLGASDSNDGQPFGTTEFVERNESSCPTDLA